MHMAQGSGDLYFEPPGHTMFTPSTDILKTGPGPDVTTSTTVAAGVPLLLGFNVIVGNAYCNFNRAFIPTAGQSYSLFAGDTLPTVTGFWGMMFKGPEYGAKCIFVVATKGPDGKLQQIPTDSWSVWQ